MPSLFEFTANRIDGEQVSLAEYRGKVTMLVNTATECGFTPQLKELQSLYEQYHGRDFEILAFPSNDFGDQEPREGHEIEEYCGINFGVTFPIFAKIRVRGPHASDLFKWLGDKKANGRFSSTPRWNFTKYLFNRRGEPQDFYYPFTKPSSARIRKDIQRLLNLQA